MSINDRASRLSIWPLKTAAEKESPSYKPPRIIPDDRTLFSEISQQVFQELLQEQNADDDRVKEIIARVTGNNLSDTNPGLHYRNELQERIFNRFRRLDLLQPLLDDHEITEIMVNGPQQIFFEKQGCLLQSPQRFTDTQHLTDVITGFFSRYNVALSVSHPLGSIRLPDGSRAHAVLAPIAQGGPVLTIRKFSGIRPGLPELIRSEFMPENCGELLIRAVRNRKAIMIGGGTGTGKTTLLNILSAYIPEDERIITVEDSPELQLQNRSNWVRLTCRQDGPEGSMTIDSGMLIRNALRMRPDRIIVGEVRGDEAYDMMQAASTGHPGTLCTIHGNTCEGMLLRLADLILAASRLSYEVILHHLASCFQILVHIARDDSGARHLEEVVELSSGQGSNYVLKTVYRRQL